jgi:predicted membrane channel-forming protein YqfA (hemolysin III family)
VEQGEEQVEQVDGAKKTSKQVSYTFAYYTICPIIFICFFVQKASDSNGKKTVNVYFNILACMTLLLISTYFIFVAYLTKVTSERRCCFDFVCVCV